jgi:hypothetical protein
METATQRVRPQQLYDLVEPTLTEQKRFIGNGRSAKVYLSYVEGEGIATKTFTGEFVSKVILFVLTGSANPYTWCEDAIHAAIIRRRMLSQLCRVWFKGRMELPKTYGYKWNAEHNAFEINAAFIKGQHAPLFSPMHKNPTDYLTELKQQIMKPLQKNLISSGFDGLVWQAGKGNPVGASNFMLEHQPDGGHRWVWIDLESGLPALFALNPLSTLFYYLPKCIKHRDWLFDNVDTGKLSRYLEDHKESIIQELGLKNFVSMQQDCSLLGSAQSNWKNIKRYRRSLYYAASQGKISADEKEYYENKPFRWYLKSIFLFLNAFVRKISEIWVNFKQALIDFPYRKMMRRVGLYFSNARYRWGAARWYLKKEIEKWHSRKFLTDEEVGILNHELKNTESGAYLTDFSIHLACKPVVKLFAWVIMPTLIASGIYGLQPGALVILFAGPIVRTGYTSWRITHSLVKSRSYFPWLALIVGMSPFIGSLAYPVELLYRSTGKKDKFAKFIAYNFSAKIGAKIPVWGGKDTETEHFFNRICHRILG